MTIFHFKVKHSQVTICTLKIYQSCLSAFSLLQAKVDDPSFCVEVCCSIPKCIVQCPRSMSTPICAPFFPKSMFTLVLNNFVRNLNKKNKNTKTLMLNIFVRHLNEKNKNMNGQNLKRPPPSGRGLMIYAKRPMSVQYKYLFCVLTSVKISPPLIGISSFCFQPTILCDFMTKLLCHF